MEDALARLTAGPFSACPSSLNPCCNGRCTRTLAMDVIVPKYYFVLILVVMEDALAQLAKL